VAQLHRRASDPADEISQPPPVEAAGQQRAQRTGVPAGELHRQRMSRTGEGVHSDEPGRLVPRGGDAQSPSGYVLRFLLSAVTLTRLYFEAVWQALGARRAARPRYE
jgi:hypothetical protein